MSIDNGSPAVHRRGYRPPGGESTVKLTWSEVPEVPRSPAPVRYNATNDSHAIIAARDESPAPKPAIRMHQVRALTRCMRKSCSQVRANIVFSTVFDVGPG